MASAQNAYKKAYEKAKKAEMTQSSTMTAEEMYKLGLNYYEGKNGKTQNYTEAVKWFRQAAEQGNAKAQNFMGVCCYNGSGVTQDYNEALKWYRKAADKGSASAQYNLGICYYTGRGVTQDYNEALKWYRKAADKGSASAQYNLGRLTKVMNGRRRNCQNRIKVLHRQVHKTVPQTAHWLKRLQIAHQPKRPRRQARQRRRGTTMWNSIMPKVK